MRIFAEDGIELAFIDEGEGRPVLLVHGFGSTHRVNWVDTGWVTTLTRAGCRVVAFDNRGHGASTKLYDPADYETSLMARDAARLLAHLGIGRAAAMGYSMGARIAAFLALRRPDLVDVLVLGGLGIHLVDGVGLPTSIAEALEAPSLEDVTDQTGRMFRAFAEQTRSDRRALAACIRGSRQTLTPAEAGEIRQPTMIAVGTRDKIAGSAGALASLLPNAVAVDIPDRDHNPAVGDKRFKEAVTVFLADHPA